MARKPASLRDWLLGSQAKRLVLHALLAEPERLWTKTALASSAGVDRHGGVDDHVAALHQLGLLSLDGARWRLRRAHPLVEPIDLLLQVLEGVPESELDRT